MSFFTFFDRTKKHFAAMLILAIFLPSVYFSFPQKADAAGWPVWTAISDFLKGATMPSEFETGTATGVQAGNGTAQTGLQVAQHLKTWVLDPMAMMMAKIIIQDITASTVKWINTGFKGNPAFVQNPEQFFLNVGDQTAATYLSTTNSHFINDICTPFSAKIRLALVQSYLSTKTPNRCTIQSIVKNWTNFGTNFYDNGGWDGWFSMTQSDSNNPLGVYLQEKDSFNSAIGNKINHYTSQLSQGNGFLSWETCKTASQVQGPQPVAGAATGETGTCYTGTDTSQMTKSECDAIIGVWDAPAEVDTSDAATPTLSQKDCPLGTNVNTPGSVIEKQLANTLDSPVNQLGVAQSINQIVGALMTQMIKSVVGGFGSGGLSGLSQSSSATQSLQSQLETNATTSSPQFQAVQNQITGTEQDVMNKSTAGTSDAGATTANGPTITLIGAGDPTKGSALDWAVSVTDPVTSIQTHSWIDPGYTAADNIDGNITDITSGVIVTGAVDATTPGEYNLKYDVTDSQGLSAPEVMRVVNVQ
jgi:hypothetical protein